MGICWALTLLFFGALLCQSSFASEEEILEDILLEETEGEETRERFRRQSGCKDFWDSCSRWPDTHCQDYENYMKTNCPRKCGHCSGGPTEPPACEDNSQYCGAWNSSGYCDPSSQWHSYMKSNCKKSCGFCGGDGDGGSDGSSCVGGESSKIKGCKFDRDTCDWHDVPFDDDEDFQVKSSGGHGRSGGYLEAARVGKAQLLLPMELILDHEANHGDMCFRFHYKMPQGGNLTLYEVKNQRGGLRTLLVRKSGSSSQWQCAKVKAQVSVHRQLLFEATVKDGPVQIDDVSFTDGSC